MPKDSFYAGYAVEKDAVEEAAKLLSALGCLELRREYELRSSAYRIDLAGKLPIKGGLWVPVECKRFESISHYIDAIDQAASYADHMRYPCFIGPVYCEGPMELSCCGRTKAISALLTLAARWNVGALYKTRWNRAGLLFRGQVLICDTQGPHSNFEALWRYKRRAGSGAT